MEKHQKGYLDAEEITQIARKAITDYVENPTTSFFDSSPLDNKAYTACVTLRVNGKVRGCYSATMNSIQSAIIVASRRSVDDCRDGKRITLTEIGICNIEVWILTERIRVENFERHHLWGDYGFELQINSEKKSFFLPTIPIERQISDENLLLNKLYKKGRVFSSSSRNNCSLNITKWDHYVECKNTSHVFQRLYKKSEKLDKTQLINLSQLVANHLSSIQVSKGEYLYKYNALKGIRFHDNNNPVRQIGCTFALTAFNTYLSLNQEVLDFKSTVKKSISLGLNYIKDLLFIRDNNVTFNHPNNSSLGFTAFALLALSNINHAEISNSNLTKSVLSTIINSQSEQGWFPSDLKKQHSKGLQDFAPAQAILALAHNSNFNKTGVYEIILKSFEFYSNEKCDKKSKFYLAWQSKAWCAVYRATHNRKYYELARKFLYKLSKLQISTNSRSIPDDFIGGYFESFSNMNINPPSFLVSLFTEAFLMGWSIAVELDEVNDAKIFHTHSQLGLIFLEKLIIRKEQSFLFQEPEIAVGGVRGNLASFDLRCDYSMHALTCLTEAMKVNFKFTD